MARTVALSVLRSDVRRQADIGGATVRHTDAQLNRYINQSIQAFRERISDEGSTHYLVSGAGTLGVGPTSPYPFYQLDLSSLSPALVRTYGIDVTFPGGQVVTLAHVPFEERAKYGTTAQGGVPQAWAHFRTDQVAILPASDSAYTDVVWYLPKFTDLSADGDTFDGVAGWEEWVVWDVVTQVIARDQFPQAYQIAEARRAEVEQRVIRGATKVSQAGGAHVARDSFGKKLTHFLGDRNPPRLAAGGGASFEAIFGRGSQAGDRIMWDGAAWVKRRFWITPDIDLTGVTDATAAINAALASRAGACVYIPDGIVKIASGLTMTLDSTSLVGNGDFNGSTLKMSAAAAFDAVTVSAQHCRIEKLRITSDTVFTTGWAIKLALGAYQTKIERCALHEVASGVYAHKAILTTLRDIEIANTYGPYGVLGEGASGETCEAVIITGHCPFNNAYPYTIVGNGTIWAQSTAYVTGNVVYANDSLFQCRLGGTSASSGAGPSGAPTTSTSTARTTDITDGTVTWRYAGPFNAWLVQESFCNTFDVGPEVGCISGGRGFRMLDSVGSSSRPIIARINGTQFDHNFTNGIQLSGGQDATLIAPWVSSVLAEDGVRVNSTFGNGQQSSFQIVGGQVFGSAGNGLLMDAGGWDIDGLRVGNNGTLASDTYDGLRVSAGVSDWAVRGGFYGSIASGNVQRWGIVVFAGASDRFLISGARSIGNIRAGNVVHGIQNDGTGANAYADGNIGSA